MGEIKKKKSDFFYAPFLQPDIQSSMSPLEWWKQAATSVVPKKLLEMIEILFLIPAGTGGIERCFSTMGNIMTKKRNRLEVETAAKLANINGFF